MDTFFEQIISIRKNGKTFAAVLGIWILAIILCAFLFLFPILRALTILLVCGIIFGAYKLASLFNIEYEYIITNGTLDIDKIINKSSRKRVLSLELANVSRLEKYNPATANTIKSKELTFACNENDEGAYLLVAERDGKPASYLVFAPNERIKEAIIKFVPKYIANNAFKEN